MLGLVKGPHFGGVFFKTLLLVALFCCRSSNGSGPEYEHGAQQRFVCTPIPADTDPGCFPTVGVPLGAGSGAFGSGQHGGGPGSSSGGGVGGGAGSSGSSWWGLPEEAKATILHLRESLVQQKETILDQRDKIRELTAKLTLCEGFTRGMAGNDRHLGPEPHLTHHTLPHHSGYPDGGHHGDPEALYPAMGLRGHHKTATLGNKHPGEMTPSSSSSPEQLERMLHMLKERLESLQVRAGQRSGLREENDPRVLDNTSPLTHKLTTLFWIQPGSHKKTKVPDGFQIGFPMRTNYMYGRVKHTLHHEIFALTLCLWLRGGTGPGLGTPFSYSVPGQANELVLIEWGNNPMELLVNDNVSAVTLPLSLSDGKWHHVCVTWSTRDGLWEAYQDGVKRGSGENLSAWHPIKPGGVFILGQEQDTLGGRFDATQAFVGEISDLQMWSHILTSRDIYSLGSCSGHMTGDIIAWSESALELHGGVTNYPFDPCH
ncbi:hypothetical protein ACEWY4_020290 [Coilia grayii]|uniref:Pentraxin (PTX) domain-containing protein n=1 Tax=Coilia grayii TaxID=363190 RepID=A0ABD1JC65_9TELE